MKNNLGPVTSSVEKAAEVLGSLLNTHKCLIKTEVEIQKKATHPININMSIGYSGKASGGNDSTTTVGSHDWEEQSLGKPVRFSERQVYSERHPGSDGRGTGKRTGFCALISIDIRNAFNTRRSKNRIDAKMRKKILDYLLLMIDNYLSNRWVIYEGNKMVSQRRDDMLRSSGVVGRTIREECHV